MENIIPFLNAKLVWFLIGVGFIVIEFVAPALVSLFFGLSALVVMALLFFFPLSLNAQIGIFLAASILLLLLFRRKCMIIFTGHTTEKNPSGDLCDDFIGFKALAETDLQPRQNGKINFRGSLWDAEAPEFIAKGSSVEITGKKSLTLLVKKL